MSNTKTSKPYEDAIEIIMRRERIPYTGVYETTQSTPSSMDDPSIHVL